MEFWNFVHNTLGLHVWFFLAVVLLAVMGIVALIHNKKQKDREKENEEALENLNKVPGTSREKTPATGETPEDEKGVMI